MRSNGKRAVRDRALKALKKIRQDLGFEVVTKKIDLVLAGAEEVIAPREPLTMQQGKASVLSGLDDLRAAVLSGISTKKDMIRAMGYWSAAFLLDFTMEQRTVICTALIEKSKALGLKPKPTWVSVLKDPMFFEQWSHEVYDGVKRSADDSLDEVAL